MNSSKRGAAYGFRLQSLDLVSKIFLISTNREGAQKWLGTIVLIWKVKIKPK